MGFAIVLLQLSLLCFTVFGDEEIEAVSPATPHHGYYHHPAMAPTHQPSHRHRHHSHAPTVAPSLAPSHHHHHSPVYSPMHSPAHAPVHPPMPPSHPPVHPPLHPPPAVPHPHPPAKSPRYHFPRSFVAVQGVVYCKSCNYSGVDTLVGAKPLPGATVKLQCNNTKYPVEAKATTDKNGYFFLEAAKTVTSYGAHKCKVSLFKAPNTACSKITNLHGGYSGGALRPEKKAIVNKLPFVIYSVGPFAFEPKCPPKF